MAGENFIDTLNGGVLLDDTSINSGTGNYDTFLRIQANGSETGFNTDQNGNPLDIKSSFTDSIQLSTLQTVNIGGVDYYVIRLDLNEQNNENQESPQITLTDLRIYVSGAPATTANYPNFSGFTPVYTLTDAPLQLTEHSTGSGHDDYGFFIPVSLFGGASGSQYMTLVSTFTGSGGGFEEWRALSTSGGGGGNPSFSIDLEKNATVDGGTVDHVGEVINYTIDVTNTGTAGLHGVNVSDPFVSNLAAVTSGGFNTGDIDHDNVLDVGETWHYTASHTVTQAEIDNGGVVDPEHTIDNTASVSTTEGVSDSDTAAVPVEQNPSVDLTKHASVDGDIVDEVGDIINYTIDVHNNGNMTLTNVVVTDDFADNLDNDADNDGFIDGDTDHDGKLDVGETWHYTASHTVTQDDIDNGGVVDPALTIDNTASVTTHEGATDEDTASVPVDQNPDVELTKHASVAGGVVDEVGDVINYTIDVHNNGNMTLTNVVVTDDFADNLDNDADNDGFIDGDTDHDGDLDVGETWHYTASHTVTQGDIDNGGVVDPALTIDNTASVTTHEGATDEDTASVPVDQNPDVELTKHASVAGGIVDAVGDVINYTIDVHNTGNMTLTDVLVTDDFADNLDNDADNDGFIDGDTDHDGDLDVGETWHYTASHTVTQDDIDNGGVVDPALTIDNTASVTTHEGATDEDTASVPVDQNPDVELTKEANIAGGVADAVGDVINYTIDVHNNGNMTLTNVVVTDDFADNLDNDADNDGFIDGDTDHDGDLDVGETWHYTATHAVTQADLDAGGTIDNTASVTTTQGAEDEDSASVPVVQDPSIDVEKTGHWVDTDNDGIADIGERVNFDVTVTNDGNVTLHGLTLSDPKLTGLGALTAVTVDHNGTAYNSGDLNFDNELDVGETWNYTGYHTITSSDFNSVINDGNGHGHAVYSNTVTGTAYDPQNDPAKDTDTATVDLPFVELQFTGRTQGFWKEHEAATKQGKKTTPGAWDDGYTKDTSYDGFVGFNAGLGSKDKFLDLLNSSSLGSPQQNQELALARQVIASVLNAADSANNTATDQDFSDNFPFTVSDIREAVQYVYGADGNTGNFNSDRDNDGIRDSQELQQVLDYYNNAGDSGGHIASYDPHYLESLMGQDANHMPNFLHVYGTSV